MTVITIPTTTLPIGTREFGPAAIPNGATFVDISVDRTVVGGLNSLTNTTQLVLSVFESLDGGNTWNMVASTTCVGGVFTMHGGLPLNFNDVGAIIYPNATHIKASVNVIGTSVTVAGTLTVQ